MELSQLQLRLCDSIREETRCEEAGGMRSGMLIMAHDVMTDDGSGCPSSCFCSFRSSVCVIKVVFMESVC